MNPVFTLLKDIDMNRVTDRILIYQLIIFALGILILTSLLYGHIK